MAGFAPLETERLQLDRLEPEDAPALAELARDPAVARHTAHILEFSPGATAAWIDGCATQMAMGQGFVFAVRRRGDRAPLGAVGVALAGSEATLGYWLGRRHWGRGYATEAARRVVGLAFETLGANRVSALVQTGNAASVRVMEKLGFAFEARRHQHLPGREAPEEVAIYRVERSGFLPPAGLPVVLIAAAALIDGNGRVLIARRPEGKAMAGLWEFPGGKVDRGEAVPAALVRELGEELGVAVAVEELSPVAVASHRYDDFHLLMPLLSCRRWQGTPSGRERQRLAWVPPAALDTYPMPPADLPLVVELRRLVC